MLSLNEKTDFTTELFECQRATDFQKFIAFAKHIRIRMLHRLNRRSLFYMMNLQFKISLRSPVLSSSFLVQF